MRHHSYSLPKKLTFAKFAHGQTNRWTKKVTSKVPFRINARELKRDLAKSTKIQKIFFAPTIKELEKDLPDLEFIETLFNP